MTENQQAMGGVQICDVRLGHLCKHLANVLLSTGGDGGIRAFGTRTGNAWLIFAKDDSHADDIVQVVREEFNMGNDAVVKITYRTTGAKPEDLLASFRNSYNPRIVGTVDMIATGTDVRPLECVFFILHRLPRKACHF